MTAVAKKKLTLKCERCGAKFRTTHEDAKFCGECKKPLKPGNANVEVTQPNGEAPKPSLDVQKIVNELMWKHGDNLENRGDFTDILAEVGLDRGQVTPKVISLAKKYCQEKEDQASKQPKPALDNKITWVLEPKEEERTLGKAHVWTSECGRYRVDRLDTSDLEHISFLARFKGPKGIWDAFELDGKQNGANHPKYYRHLEKAVLSVEKFHMERAKVETLTSNREELLAQAHKLGLDRGKPAAQTAVRGAQGGDKPAQVREPGEGTDNLGSRLGSNTALINAALTHEPQKMKDIVKKAGLVGTYYNHLNALVSAKKIEKNSEGYFLKKE